MTLGSCLLGISLYSDRYPAVGESYGLSCVVGQLIGELGDAVAAPEMLDLSLLRSSSTDLVRAKMRGVGAGIILFSVPYGTYNALSDLRRDISRAIDGGALVVVGGALPTYLGEQLLREIDPRLVVVLGEGEPAIGEVVSRWMRGAALDGVTNSLVLRDGKPLAGPRVLAEQGELHPPYRDHLRQFVGTKSQFYAETSRGCSWAACSFCLRGLTDIAGRPSEFRRLPAQRLAEDLAQLRSIGARSVSFTDEDFLGGTLADAEALVAELATGALSNELPKIKFGISTTVRSVWDSRDSEGDRSRRRAVLRRLCELGLARVFLGVESASPTQLRRYHKGHTAGESAEACREVLKLGLDLEVGFIPFDPLVTLGELNTNFDFMLRTGLARHVSAPANELRLQQGSRYLRLMHGDAEGLLLGDADCNTLEIPYRYMQSEVVELTELVRRENQASYTLRATVKAVARSEFAKSDHCARLASLLVDYRVSIVKALRCATLQRGAADFGRMTSEARNKLARAVFGVLGTSGTGDPLVSQALDAAAMTLQYDAHDP